MARLTLALIDRLATERATPSERTSTLRYAGNWRQDAGPTIQALSGKALHRTVCAVLPRPAWRTLARVIRIPVDANPTVFARIRKALVDICNGGTGETKHELERPSFPEILKQTLTVLTEGPRETGLTDAARAQCTGFAFPTTAARGHRRRAGGFVRHRTAICGGEQGEQSKQVVRKCGLIISLFICHHGNGCDGSVLCTAMQKWQP